MFQILNAADQFEIFHCNFLFAYFWLQDLSVICTFKYAVLLSKPLDGSDEDSLRRLGKILHLSKSRSLIVRCDESRFVKLGTKVCDSKLKEIGRVQDLFGPVTSPYVAVRPTVSSPAKFVHRIVYSFD